MSATESVYASNSNSAGDPPWWIGDFPPQWPQVTPTSVPVQPGGITFLPNITIQTGTVVPIQPQDCTVDGDGLAGPIELSECVVWICSTHVESYMKGNFQTRIGFRWSRAQFEQRLRSLSGCSIHMAASSLDEILTLANPLGAVFDRCELHANSSHELFMREVCGWTTPAFPGFESSRLSFVMPGPSAPVVEPKKSEEEGEKEELDVAPKRLIEI